MKKSYFFEVDSTLTEIGERCSPKMGVALRKLSNKANVIFISSEEFQSVKSQVPHTSVANVYVLSHSGTRASHWTRVLWEKKLTTVHRAAISEHIRILKSLMDTPSTGANDIVEDRGGTIVYSLAGHSEKTDIKKKFDIDGSIRRELLQKYPLQNSFCQVRIGELDTLEYTAKDWGLCKNIAQFIRVKSWKIEDCTLVSHSIFEEQFELFEGGHIFYASGPDATLEFIHKLIGE